MVHGGGFDQGTKKSYVGPALEVLTKANYAWFSIDYRLAPDYRFPQPVEDVNSAIRWVKANAKGAITWIRRRSRCSGNRQARIW